jgi:hypothetical protein
MESKKPFIVTVAEQIAATGSSLRDEYQELEKFDATIAALKDQCKDQCDKRDKKQDSILEKEKLMEKLKLRMQKALELDENPAASVASAVYGGSAASGGSAAPTASGGSAASAASGGKQAPKSSKQTDIAGDVAIFGLQNFAAPAGQATKKRKENPSVPKPKMTPEALKELVNKVVSENFGQSDSDKQDMKKAAASDSDKQDMKKATQEEDGAKTEDDEVEVVESAEKSAQKKPKTTSPRMCWNAKTGKWNKLVTKFFNSEIALYCSGFDVHEHSMLLVEDLETLLSAELVKFLKTQTTKDLFKVIDAHWELTGKDRIKDLETFSTIFEEFLGFFGTLKRPN